MKKQLLLFLTIALFSQSFTFAQNSEYVLFFDNTTEGQSIKYSDDATTSAMDGATDYTIEMWVKPNDNTANGDVFMSFRNEFRITFWSNNRFYFTHKTPDPLDGSGSINNLFFNSTNDALALNEWNHIAIICNSTDGANGSIKLYVNGVDVTADSYDAIALVGGADNNDVFIGYGDGNYPNMHAREIRVKKTAEDIANLHTDIADDNYTTDADTTVLFHFAEGSGTTTVNAATGTDANLGFGGSHYPTWVLLSSTLAVENNNTTDFSIFPNPVVNNFFTVQALDNEFIQKVELSDLQGKLVQATSFDSNENNVRISTKGLNTGLYILKTTTNVGVGTKKLVIE